MATVTPDAYAVRPLSAERVETIRRHATAAWRAWCEQWGADEQAGSVSCRPATREDKGAAWADGAADAALAGVRIQRHNDLYASVASSLFGPLPDAHDAAPAARQVAYEAATALSRDLSRALAELAGAPGTIPSPQAFERHAGTAIVELRIAEHGGSLKALVPAASMPAPKPSRERPLTPLTQALDTQRVRMSLTVGEIAMTLGEIAQVGPGDVLPLSTRIDRPLALQLDDGSAPLSAFVGMRGRQLAVRLVSTGEHLA
ncbi:FliM/FliN family flagellar motor switch protein [Aquabacterium humicola]|uniref:FliM/FliN family flagellar motor switch protein n=1 Tax=Aquabacterium humicola TaxID=3237377 RepID=UPI002542D945|nr:FliM/FliN family flagellar motor switch protein [Rubrivivax pictus]